MNGKHIYKERRADRITSKPVKINVDGGAIVQTCLFNIVLCLQEIDDHQCRFTSQRLLEVPFASMIDVESAATKSLNSGQAIDDVTEFSAMTKRAAHGAPVSAIRLPGWGASRRVP